VSKKISYKGGGSIDGLVWSLSLSGWGGDYIGS